MNHSIKSLRKVEITWPTSALAIRRYPSSCPAWTIGATPSRTTRTRRVLQWSSPVTTARTPEPGRTAWSIYKLNAARGVQLVAISANDAKKYPDDGFPRMRQRSEEKGFNFPYLYDESQEIARAYGAERTPEIFLFDK